MNLAQFTVFRGISKAHRDNISFKFGYGFVLIEYISVIAQTSITHN